MLLSHSANLVDARRSEEEKNPLNATQGDKSEATLGADITSRPGRGIAHEQSPPLRFTRKIRDPPATRGTGTKVAVVL